MKSIQIRFRRDTANSQFFVPPVREPNVRFHMPSEEERHEGTWLQWPHDNGWDSRHVERLEDCWIQMTEALHLGERVRIIVYDTDERKRVKQLLEDRGLDMAQIDFFVWPTDDVWIRDNGPIFSYDDEDRLVVENWKFNGWGNKAESWFSDYIPLEVAHAQGLDLVSIPMVNEGGSIEVDGRGTLMAKKSSILNRNRNPGWTQADAEAHFRKYLGVDNFIWLDGTKGGSDITDDHIDGTARFANGDTIVTHSRSDFMKRSEYDVLKKATNAQGDPYNLVHLPLTRRKVSGANDYGIYINYYVGNDVVIVPTYDDPSDGEAIETLKSLYHPRRKVVGINCAELYKDGGTLHCVTQQEPVKVRRRM